jgi:predicted acylesterase/phospholipase RssA
MRPAFGEYLRRARIVPPLLARSAWRYLTPPLFRRHPRVVRRPRARHPTGVFDNEAIHEYLAAVFTQPGHTNDFRELSHRLYLVATDLDSGQSVSFGRPGHDHVPISKAVQASAALPGLFPPVEIDGRHFVDGALRKTLHASEALDDGVKLVICVNPIVPFDAKLAAERGRGPQTNLVDGGLPVVLSQTFRAVIHSRMATGLSKYRTQYRGPTCSSSSPSPTTARSSSPMCSATATRQRVCEHAYARTRRDLAKRAASSAPSWRATASRCAPTSSPTRIAGST